MVFDKRLLRWLNCLGGAVVMGLVLYIGFISWRANDSLKRAAPVPGMDEFHESVWEARHAASEKRLSDAEAAYRHALVLRPGSPSITLELARFYEDHGQDAKAVREYQPIVKQMIDAARARRSTTESTMTLVRYGDLLLRQGGRAKAHEVFQVIVWAGDPPRNTKLNTLDGLRAESYSRVGWYEDAIKLNPRLWTAYQSLVFKSEDRAAALQRFERAVKSGAGDPMGHLVYSNTLQSLGRRAEAVAYLRKVVPTLSPGAADLLRKQIDDYKRDALREAKMEWECRHAQPGTGCAGPPLTRESRFDGPVARGFPFGPNGVPVSPGKGGTLDSEGGPGGPSVR